MLALIPVALALSACGKKEQALPTLGDAGKSAPQAVASVAITPAAPSDAEQGEFVAKMQKELDEVKGHISELRQTVNTRSGEAKSKLKESISKLEAAQREAFAYVAAGAIAQNVYLFAASNQLSTVIRTWIDREAIAEALGLTHDQQVLLSQTVGYPKPRALF